MWASRAALFLRQIGHAVLEPPRHDKEALLLGFNTPSKTAILATYLLIPVAHLVARIWTGQEFVPMMARSRASGSSGPGSWWADVSRTWSGSTVSGWRWCGW